MVSHTLTSSLETIPLSIPICSNPVCSRPLWQSETYFCDCNCGFHRACLIQHIASCEEVIRVNDSPPPCRCHGCQDRLINNHTAYQCRSCNLNICLWCVEIHICPQQYMHSLTISGYSQSFNESRIVTFQSPREAYMSSQDSAQTIDHNIDYTTPVDDLVTLIQSRIPIGTKHSTPIPNGTICERQWHAIIRKQHGIQDNVPQIALPLNIESLVSNKRQDVRFCTRRIAEDQSIWRKHISAKWMHDAITYAVTSKGLDSFDQTHTHLFNIVVKLIANTERITTMYHTRRTAKGQRIWRQCVSAKRVYPGLVSYIVQEIISKPNQIQMHYFNNGTLRRVTDQSSWRRHVSAKRLFNYLANPSHSLVNLVNTQWHIFQNALPYNLNTRRYTNGATDQRLSIYPNALIPDNTNWHRTTSEEVYMPCQGRAFLIEGKIHLPKQVKTSEEQQNGRYGPYKSNKPQRVYKSYHQNKNYRNSEIYLEDLLSLVQNIITFTLSHGGTEELANLKRKINKKTKQ